MELSRWLALTVLCAASMMIILDGTIVTVALPTIQRQLGFSASGPRLGGERVPDRVRQPAAARRAARRPDRRQRIFLAGLIVFSAASLVCGLSVSQPMLIAARFDQGAGGAMALAVSLGMIVRLFPEPPQQARAIGAYSFVGAAGASVGLVLGGVLTQALSWHWIFFVNVPIGVAGDRAGRRLLPRRSGIGLARRRRRRRGRSWSPPADGRRLRDRRDGRYGWGSQDARPAAAAPALLGRVRGPPAERRTAAPAAAHVPFPYCSGADARAVPGDGGARSGSRSSSRSTCSGSSATGRRIRSWACCRRRS